MFNRRSMILTLGSLLGALATRPTLALAATVGESNRVGIPFTRQLVLGTAQALAARAFEKPNPVPAALRTLDYDAYRQIRYRKDEAIWGTSPTAFSI